MTGAVSAPTSVHIIGIGGSGKTTLARWYASEFGLARHGLDAIAYGNHVPRSSTEIASLIDAIVGEDGWVTEGAYHEPWIAPLLAAAGTIVWLDLGVSTCLARMVKRHVRAELSRSNEHPGWRQLLRFMNHTRSSASEQARQTARLLSPYPTKVRRCSTARDVVLLQRAAMRDSRASPTATAVRPAADHLHSER